MSKVINLESEESENGASCKEALFNYLETDEKSIGNKKLREKLRKVENDLTEIEEKIKFLKNEHEEKVKIRDILNAKLNKFNKEINKCNEKDSIDLLLNREEIKRGKRKLNDVHEWDEELMKQLKYFFNISKFKQNQREVINDILKGNTDVILIMPTGGGKSLCFQLPLIYLDRKLCVIISPLISLMTDQVMSLRSIGMNARMFTANTTKEELEIIKKEMCDLQTVKQKSKIKEFEDQNLNEDRNSHLRFLYITPEKLTKSKRILSSLEKIYEAGNLRLIVIDEVHCVSEWGNSFRIDYKKLNLLKIHFPNTPLLCLTATATQNVILDIKNILQLNYENLCIYKTNLNRKNIFYEIRQKPSKHEDVLTLIFNFIKNFNENDCGIIYCITKKEAQNLCQDLQTNFNFKCDFYHADMDFNHRQKVYERWVNREITIIICTVAFGMGINKEDVRFIVHLSLPKSVDNYIQETGRCGRDNKSAYCLLLYKASDIFKYSTMIYYIPNALNLLYNMILYCVSFGCRRKFISKYFNESYEDEHDEENENCVKNEENYKKTKKKKKPVL